jgi:hypothetical protein
MIKLADILSEQSLSIYKIDVLIKTEASFNKVLIYNEVRGLPGVVVVTVEQSDFLDNKATDRHEFSLLKMKFLVSSTPKEDIIRIKNLAFAEYRVEGLVKFVPRFSTIYKVGQY